MFKKLLKSSGPHLLSILVFLAVASAYFSPLVSGKKVMFQSDIQQAEGMSHELKEFQEKTGEQSMWTNSMFGGMPAYQISAKYPNNWAGHIFSAITYGLGYDRWPLTSLFLLMTCFFIMLVSFKINVWIAMAVSIGYAFSTFNIIGIEVGHSNKIWVLMYSPLILAGINLVFRKLYLAGAGLTAFALTINLYANHLQITYYMLITIVIFMLVKLVFAIREKQLKDYIIAGCILLGSAVIGILPNTSTLWTTYEYGKVSTRGGSELTLEEGSNQDGLDYDYIFNDYSYSRLEPLTFLVPNAFGGASAMEIDKKSELARMTGQNVIPTYWGDQRYVAGPFYLGAIICFLFVLGLLVAKTNSKKVWLIITAFLALSLSMGKNSLFLSDLFFNAVPLYDKFRSVTMFTAITQLCFAFLGAMGLHAVIENLKDEKFIKKLNLAFYITGGLSLVLALIGSSLFDFLSAEEAKANINPQVLDALTEYRAGMLRNDAFRSFAFIALAWLGIHGLKREMYKMPVLGALLALFMLLDQWTVNTRYGEQDRYKRKSKNEVLFTASTADRQILEDPSLDYRVLNMSLRGGPFNDATTSYFHKSIGGYHGAKMRRYQDLIERGITPEMNGLINQLNDTNRNFMTIDAFMSQGMPVLNMLNTKYIILNPEGAPLKNNYALGNAWFVSDVKKVGHPNDEILSLQQGFYPAKTAVVNEEFADYVNGVQAAPGATIVMEKYEPNHLVYKSNSSQEALAVFSEIYYPYGWTAYIDNQEVEHIRANYILRALKVPAGQHTIEFKFHPSSFYTGEQIALAGSVSMVLLILVALGFSLRRTLKSEETA